MDNRYSLYTSVYVDIQNRALDRPFTYAVPENLSDMIYIGAVVRVPFNNREITGYVVDVFDFPPSVPTGVTIKPISEIIPGTSVWDREMIALAHWLEKYYSCTFVTALKTLVPGSVRITAEGKPQRVARVKKVISVGNLEAAANELEKKAPVQARVLRFLSLNPGVHTLAEVTASTGSSHACIQALVQKNLVTVFDDLPPQDLFRNYPPETSRSLELTPDQRKVFTTLCDLVQSEQAQVALLHGITGSGKTEIYLQVIEEVLKKGKEALVLVPEISLTPQAVERFRGRFAENIAVLHSRLTDAERRQMWWNIRNKGARVVLGARSAVFAPLENIGVIVVDEEHESSYKQEKDPRYHARQVAIRRALTHKSLVILGSATPSLEVFHWAMEKKYHYLHLPNRVGESVLPEIQIVDLNKDFGEKKSALPRSSRGIIGLTLRQELERVLNNGEQTILFLNRRGFAAFLLCRECGNVIRCPYCAITLTFHKNDRLLKCHYCDYNRPAPDLCPFCSGTKLVPLSWGIQKVEEEVRELFPETPLIRMDRDTTSGRDAHYRILKQFADQKASILLGTQMVAKGLDFPGVTLVGVILGDVSLYLPDFRSIERTYQILTQVAGRAGRRETRGKVIIQTFSPNSPVYRAVMESDYGEFFRWELEHRRQLSYPPFSHVVNILLTGENSEAVREHSMRIAELLRMKGHKKILDAVLGPAPCIIARIRSRYRWHITLKGKDVFRMVALFRAAEKRYPSPAGIHVALDVDPVALL